MSTRTLRSHNGLGELPAAKFSTSSNFDVVLRSIRGVLKLDWCFYEEALEGVVRAGAHGGDVTPWLSQMQQLADSKPEIAISHAGVLCLLQDMGVKLLRPRHGGGHGNSEKPRAGARQCKQTPPVCQRMLETFARTPVSSRPVLSPKVMPMAPPPLPVHSTRPEHSVQIQRRPAARDLTDPAGPVFFTDPHLYNDVRSYMVFGHTQPPRTSATSAGSPPYKPSEDDFLVWKQKYQAQ